MHVQTEKYCGTCNSGRTKGTQRSERARSICPSPFLFFWFWFLAAACSLRVLNHSRRRVLFTAPSTIPSRVDDSCPLGAILPDVLTQKEKTGTTAHKFPSPHTPLLLLGCSPPVSFLCCYRAVACPRVVCPPLLHPLYNHRYILFTPTDPTSHTSAPNAARPRRAEASGAPAQPARRRA